MSYAVVDPCLQGSEILRTPKDRMKSLSMLQISLVLLDLRETYLALPIASSLI